MAFLGAFARRHRNPLLSAGALLATSGAIYLQEQQVNSAAAARRKAAAREHSLLGQYSLLASPKREDRHPRIILFGDSITQGSFSVGGWGARLQDHYQRRADVLCRGYSGYNTRWALHLLDDLFPPPLLPQEGPQREEEEEPAPTTVAPASASSEEPESATAASTTPKPTAIAASADATAATTHSRATTAAVKTRLVTVFFGANDHALRDVNERQHVPIEEYAANLSTIVEVIQGRCPGAHVVVLSPPPIHHAQRLAYQKERYGSDGATGVLERTNVMAGRYAAAAEGVARARGVPFVNLWAAMQAEATAGATGGGEEAGGGGAGVDAVSSADADSADLVGQARAAQYVE
jgi:lysophospholipase L1-like esterase